MHACICLIQYCSHLQQSFIIGRTICKWKLENENLVPNIILVSGSMTNPRASIGVDPKGGVIQEIKSTGWRRAPPAPTRRNEVDFRRSLYPFATRRRCGQDGSFLWKARSLGLRYTCGVELRALQECRGLLDHSVQHDGP